MSVSKFVVFSCLIWSVSQAYQSNPVTGEVTKLIIDQDSEIYLNGSMQSGDIQMHSLEVDEGEFVRIFLPGFHTSNEIGSPELPEIHKLIEIPQNAMPYIEVVNEETEYYISPNFNAVISSEDLSNQELQQHLNELPNMNGLDLAKEVSC